MAVKQESSRRRRWGPRRFFIDLDNMIWRSVEEINRVPRVTENWKKENVIGQGKVGKNLYKVGKRPVHNSYLSGTVL